MTDMTEQTLTIIRGLPGGGKTTLAKSLVQTTPNSVDFSADDYFMGLKTGNPESYDFDPAHLGKAHSACLDNTKKALYRGQSVFVHNTFTTAREVKPYRELAEKLGVRFEILVARGGYKSVHGVPDSAMDAMRKRWQEDV